MTVSAYGEINSANASCSLIESACVLGGVSSHLGQEDTLDSVPAWDLSSGRARLGPPCEACCLVGNGTGLSVRNYSRPEGTKL